jgi:hypothetical protein
MAISPGSALRPPTSADYKSKAPQLSLGRALVVIGLGVAMVALVSSIVQAARDGSAASIAAQAAWTFGIATAALGAIKTGIASILLGIVRSIWLRVESLKVSLPRLMPSNVESGEVREGSIDTPYGPASVTGVPPPPLPIHRMAIMLWAPMLVMGAMLVVIGLVLSFVEAGAASSDNESNFQTLRALVPGIEFFGEALLLAGISFLLGSILASLRLGGGEVQESVGAAVKTLKIPATAKLFLGLMAMGMMVSMLQIVLYIYVATLDDVSTIDTWLAWL